MIKDQLLKLLQYISKYFKWWVGVLSECKPKRLDRFFQSKAETADVLLTLNYIEVVNSCSGELRYKKFEGEYTDILDSDGFVSFLREQVKGRVSLILAPELYLERTIELPERAAKKHKDIISLKCSSIFPYPSSKVQLDSILDKQKGNGFQKVYAAMLKKDVAIGLVNVFSKAGVTLSTISGRNHRNEEHLFQFLSLENKNKENNIRRNLAKGFGTLFSIFLLFVAYSQNLSNKRLFLENSVERLSNRAAEIRLLREKVEVMETKRDFYVEKFKSTSLPQSFIELTQFTPDDGWIFELRKQGATIEIQGFSKDASQLAEQLKASDLIGSVRLENVSCAPNGSQHFERFTIVFEPQMLKRSMTVNAMDLKEDP